MTLISPYSYGPDILNYYSFTLESRSIVRLPFSILLYLSNEIFDLVYLTTFGMILLLLFVKVDKFGDIFIILFLFLLMLFFSYSANSLLGNIIRQGIATIVLIVALEFKTNVLRYVLFY